MSQYYFKKTEGAYWAISRNIQGRWVHLIQECKLKDEKDALIVLHALQIDPTENALNEYFPRNAFGERCPTFELLLLTNVLDPTHPFQPNSKLTVGV